MPMIKRLVEPVNLSRARIDKGVQNELECVTNNTLANVIRQLSSLSKHAEDMFGELLVEAEGVFQRANRLQGRIHSLTEKVARLDSAVEDVSLQDINMRKPFKSSVHREQQIITQHTRPKAIQQVYEQCDPPPALSKLNKFREDGKDSMKFYTDPSYFFELWRQGMQSEMEQKAHKKKKPRDKNKMPHHAPLRQPDNRNARYQDQAKGVEFTTSRPQQPPVQHHQQHVPEPKPVGGSRPSNLPVDSQNYMEPGKRHNIQPPPDQPPQPPPIGNGDVYIPDRTQEPPSAIHQNSPARGSESSGSPRKSSRGTPNSMLNMGDRTTLPPPPPPPDEYNDMDRMSPGLPPPPPSPPLPLPDTQDRKSLSSPLPSPPPPIPDLPIQTTTAASSSPPGAPPAPPPPPPPPPLPPSGGMAPPAPPPPPPITNDIGSPATARTARTSHSPENLVDSAPKAPDARSDLLEAIRKGMHLRKVDHQQDQKKPAAGGGLDVQSIMEKAFELRRQALEDDDSDEDDDSENSWDDDDM